jgi:hypothetical protein
MASTLRREKRLHMYAVVVGRIGEMSEESFHRLSAIKRDPSLEGRFHYRFVDSPVSFGCQVFDQKHWAIEFPPNPADPKGAGIVFKTSRRERVSSPASSVMSVGAFGRNDEP